MQKEFKFSYQEVTHYTELKPEWQSLIENSILATQKAYAPYSNFHVGAAILTESGQIFTGANQENASYSLTICAERTALGNFSMNSLLDDAISAMAISYRADKVDLHAILAPCGACRQHILEYQSKQKISFPILFTAIDGGTIIVPSIEVLLPFSFSGSALPQP